jgi:hypothetical protein
MKLKSKFILKMKWLIVESQFVQYDGLPVYDATEFCEGYRGKAADLRYLFSHFFFKFLAQNS